MLRNACFADATGNTFWIYDFINETLTSPEWERAKKEIWGLLKEGIVDDALVLRKQREDLTTLEVKMHVLEPDGTEADFCGNGARAVGTFLYHCYQNQYTQFSLSSRRGNHAVRPGDKSCFINMGQPLIDPLPVEYFYEGKMIRFYFVDCVEPHLVTEDFFEEELLIALGREINQKAKERFPQGVNLNCFRFTNQIIEVLTYERGVWKITAACGTGTTACIAQASTTRKILFPCEAHVRGGSLIFYQEEGDLWFGGSVRINWKRL